MCLQISFERSAGAVDAKKINDKFGKNALESGDRSSVIGGLLKDWRFGHRFS